MNKKLYRARIELEFPFTSSPSSSFDDKKRKRAIEIAKNKLDECDAVQITEIPTRNDVPIEWREEQWTVEGELGEAITVNEFFIRQKANEPITLSRRELWELLKKSNERGLDPIDDLMPD